MAVEIRRLQRQDNVANFDCHDPALNEYLQRFAWKNQQRNMLGVTYVSVDQNQPRLVIGYYTLATSSITRQSLPSEQIKGLPYRTLPVALLARLAVDYRFQEHGLGRALLRHALQLVITLSGIVGCRYLLVDAYAGAVPWYAKFGFLTCGGLSPSGTQSMFIDLRTVESAIAQASSDKR